ncbi:Fur family transcriptional regulator [Sporosalibacterium faouarense]|uniref:Fur family transcriptional regulator n=1 Tax=Sporosalibacterium faouarense TaxID=516123 RepID=UPI00141D1610|nr:transcriptional repressor [Sporosalibacterium faouarense]MTI49087.1 transcriptional repressor [Bacillota bacterium]
MFFKELDYVDKLLWNKGHKLTTQRKLIILEFLKNPEKHFSPIELHNNIRKLSNSQVTPSIATVYRNLKLLTEFDIIEETINKDNKLYELKLFGKKAIHIHIVCIECNRIIDYIDTDLSVKIIKEINKIEKKESFIIKNTDIKLKSICNQCLSLRR